jgi:uncharacterized membrane protein
MTGLRRPRRRAAGHGLAATDPSHARRNGPATVPLCLPSILPEKKGRHMNSFRQQPPDPPPTYLRRPPEGLGRVVAFLRGRFTAGLLIIAPFVITYLLFRWVYDTASGVFEPVVRAIFDRDIPGLSFGILIVLIFLLGLLAVRFLGQRLLFLLEAGIVRVPIIGPTFSVLKQLIATFGPMSGAGFSRVVEIEYPRKGTWAIGFMTGTTVHHDGTTMGIIYLPTAPTPNSGYLAIVPLDDVYDLDMTANQALGLTISAGIAAPKRLRRDTNYPASHNASRDPGAPDQP